MFDRLVTHSGKFHADDVFAAATMRKLAPMAPVERTREPERLEEVVRDERCVVFDVGDHFEPARNNFDHHQRGFDRAREENGIPYAAFGLVWETYGVACCRAVLDGEELAEDAIAQIARRVEVSLVWAIDAADCGVLSQRGHLKGDEEVSVMISNLSHVISLYNPRGRQPAHVYDRAFEQVLDMAQTVLTASIEAARDYVAARAVVAAADDGSPVLVLDEFVPWQAHAGDHLRFVLSPALDGSGWMVETVQDDYVPRCPLPEPWGGLREQELAAVCGVEDAIFCHRARFIAAARSLESARRMAALALEACAEGAE